MSGKTIGLTLGKFAPLHKGHQFLIEKALSEMDEVIIFIYDTHVIETPLSVRSNWLRKLYPRATIYEAWDGPTDIGDTPEICQKHENYILKRIGGKKITHFYSSEFYGDHMSKALNALNIQVDPKRYYYDISGQIIRDNPYKYRKFMDPIVYRDLIIKVVFIGAPSTGKSTITEVMAKRFDTVFMPEYGREYWEIYQVNRRLEPNQLVEIAEGHMYREEELLYQANRYLFIDTNSLTTYLFALDYHGYVLPKLESLASKAATDYDLIFLCDDDIEYDDTWDRSGDLKRKTFQKRVIADLKERRIPYLILKGNLKDRVKNVEKVLSQFEKWSNPAHLGHSLFNSKRSSY